MAVTYEPISTTTLDSATAGVTFSSIPQTYTDLIVIFYTKQTNINGLSVMRLNGATTNYEDTNLYGNGSSGSSNRDTSVDAFYFGNYGESQSKFTLGIFNIMGYTNTNTFKPVLGRKNNPGTDTTVSIGTWKSTAAITSLRVMSSQTTFTSGSTFSLYGIKAA